MELCADITVTVDGRDITLKPLTVRQRLALSNLLIKQERDKAIESARQMGLKPSEMAESVAAAVREADRMSSVVMSCWTLKGALAVLALASDAETADLIGERLEPSQLGVLAARCLNVDVSDAGDGAQVGN